VRVQSGAAAGKERATKHQKTEHSEATAAERDGMEFDVPAAGGDAAGQDDTRTCDYRAAHDSHKHMDPRSSPQPPPPPQAPPPSIHAALHGSPMRATPNPTDVRRSPKLCDRIKEPKTDPECFKETAKEHGTQPLTAAGQLQELEELINAGAVQMPKDETTAPVLQGFIDVRSGIQCLSTSTCKRPA